MAEMWSSGPVKDISELVAWQTERDAFLHSEAIDQALVMHPALVVADFAMRSQKLINAFSKRDCRGCGEPEYLIRDGQTGRSVQRCRPCINAIMRQSLGHAQYKSLEICIHCEISSDSLGLITGAWHSMMPRGDQVQPDGSIRVGLERLIASHKVDLTNNVLTVGA